MVRRRVLDLSEEIRRTRAWDDNKGALSVNERVAKKHISFEFWVLSFDFPPGKI